MNTTTTIDDAFQGAATAEQAEFVIDEHYWNMAKAHGIEFEHSRWEKGDGELVSMLNVRLYGVDATSVFKMPTVVTVCYPSSAELRAIAEAMTKAADGLDAHAERIRRKGGAS